MSVPSFAGLLFCYFIREKKERSEFVSFTTVVSVTGRHVGLLLPTLNTIVAVRGMGEPEQRFN